MTAAVISVLTCASLISASTAPCMLNSSCINGVSSSISWLLLHDPTISCEEAWSRSVSGNDGKPHWRCPPSAGTAINSWANPTWRSCEKQVMFSAAKANESICTPNYNLVTQFIKLPIDDDARCLDGSPYAFYVRPGDPTKWQIAIHGGGWCFNEVDCALRAKMWLGSSKTWTISNAGNGPPGLGCSEVLGNNCTRVFLPYCDGSSFTSFRQAPWPARDGSNQTLFFRGARNLDRVIDRLLLRHGLGHAELQGN